MDCKLCNEKYTSKEEFVEHLFGIECITKRMPNSYSNEKSGVKLKMEEKVLQILNNFKSNKQELKKKEMKEIVNDFVFTSFKYMHDENMDYAKDLCSQGIL